MAAAVVVILQLLHEFLDKPEPSEPRLLETSSCPSSYSSHPLYVRHPLWDKVHPQYPYYYFDEKSMIIVKREEETECQHYYHIFPDAVIVDTYSLSLKR